MGDLNDKIAVIIGASSSGGFGEAIARRFAAEGAKLVLSGRRAEPLEALAAETGGLAQVCDIREEAQIAALAEAARRHFGRIDIAVNAAGINHAAPIRKLTAERMAPVIETHFIGGTLFIKHMAENMEDGGAIVTISTLTALKPGPALAAYAGSKAAVDYAAKVAAMEYGARGIRVNSLSPGMVRTPLNEEMFAMPSLEPAFVKETPLGRLGRPEDIADAAVWLVCDDCFMTGQNIQANGGAALRRLPSVEEMTGS